MRSLASAILTVLVTVLAAVEVLTVGRFNGMGFLVTGFGAFFEVFHRENSTTKLSFRSLVTGFGLIVLVKGFMVSSV